MKKMYVLVEWPESQKLMDEEWFDECYLANSFEDDDVSDSAYFVPWDRYSHRAEPFE